MMIELTTTHGSDIFPILGFVEEVEFALFHPPCSQMPPVWRDHQVDPSATVPHVARHTESVYHPFDQAGPYQVLGVLRRDIDGSGLSTLVSGALFILRILWNSKKIVEHIYPHNRQLEPR